MRKYSHQAILNLENTVTSRPRAMRAQLSEKHSTEVSFIQYNQTNSDELQKLLGKMDEKSHLHICAHGSSTNSNKVYSQSNPGENLTTWSYIELANILANNLTAQNKESGKKQDLFSDRLKLSLIVCYGGKPHDQSALNSFAAKLQRELANRNIYVDISARVTLVSINPESGKTSTSTIGSEEQSWEIREQKTALIKKRKRINSKEEQKKLLKNLIKLTQEESQLSMKKQPGSKLVFKWALNDKGQQVQVAYDAYELKEHEATYRSILEISKELEAYADKRDGEDGYDEAVQEARTLATEIKVEAHKYFNSIDKTELKTNVFKRNCDLHIAKANKVLATHRDPLWKRIIGKLSLAVASVVGLSAPYFLHKHSIKNKIAFSTELFSNKTGGEKISGKFTETLGKLRPINRVR